MTEVCQDPLLFLVERLCCRVYLDGGGNVRLGFSRRHDLKDMMTAQGIVHSNAVLLRDRLRQEQGDGDAASVSPKEDSMAGHVAGGSYCPLV